ncbi:hypothetical protein PQQ51_06860 [Paraburkholderia xenovorans]|uniref:hypothetical protein n=1 Tax=Paraburkholderia xenovorans TaxID=36873 RepID=UPI0038BB9F7B
MVTAKDNRGHLISEPTAEQLEILRAELRQLEEADPKKFSFGHVIVPRSGIWQNELVSAFALGRAQCESASRYLRNPKRELLFAIAQNDTPNAWAISCGEFDAVLITSGFWLKLRKRAAWLVEAMRVRAIKQALPKDSFQASFLNDFANGLQGRLRQLHMILVQTATNYILGHEFGHLASGHLVFATASESAVDKHGFHAIDSAAEGLSKSSMHQAMELDADVQGMAWAKNMIATARPSDESEGVQGTGALLRWIQADPLRVNFVSLTGALLAFGTLGAKGFSIGALYKERSHPPTSLRAKLLVDTQTIATNAARPDLAERNSAYAKEALLAAGLGVAYEFMNKLDKNHPESAQVRTYLEQADFDDLAETTVEEMGLAAPTPKRRRMLDYYVTALALRWQALSPQCAPRARWQPGYTTPWTTINLRQNRR